MIGFVPATQRGGCFGVAVGHARVKRSAARAAAAVGTGMATADSQIGGRPVAGMMRLARGDILAARVAADIRRVVVVDIDGVVQRVGCAVGAGIRPDVPDGPDVPVSG